jgi:hypothetical protein
VLRVPWHGELKQPSDVNLDGRFCVVDTADSLFPELLFTCFDDYDTCKDVAGHKDDFEPRQCMENPGTFFCLRGTSRALVAREWVTDLPRNAKNTE